MLNRDQKRRMLRRDAMRPAIVEPEAPRAEESGCPECGWYDYDEVRATGRRICLRCAIEYAPGEERD